MSAAKQNMPRWLLGVKIEGTRLTTRESQVLRRLALGDDLPRAGRKLGISYETARSHAKAARARLGAKTTSQAVAIAVSLDMI
jgi:DNA-binding CsgD family transcriptional regulator